MTHPRHGEPLPNGFHVGDLVSYESTWEEQRYGVLVPTPERWVRPDQAHRTDGPSSDNAKWSAHWSSNPDAARDGYRRYDPEEQTESYTTRDVTLIEGSTTMTAPTETVEFWFHGEPLTNSMRVTEVVEGQEYRLIYPRDHHDMELTGVALQSGALSSGRRAEFRVTGWPRPNEGGHWNLTGHPVGSTWLTSSNIRPGDYSYNFIIPVGVRGEAPATEVQDEAHDGTKGAFLPHNGEMPEPGTIVRGFVPGTVRQVEGLFLRLEDSGATAVIERKRKRNKRANGTFGDWEEYANIGRAIVAVEGAEVFKPGASKPGEPVWVRKRGITGGDSATRAEVGEIISAPSYDTMHNQRVDIYRGEVVNTHGYGGEYTIRATEKATVNRRDAIGEYDFKPIPEEQIMVYATFSEARDSRARGAYLWDKLAPGQKPVDPAFDPRRKTAHTGMAIGDLVVGLMHGGGRDTVSSWVKGEIFKWDTRYNRPIVKVTDKMESDKKVGDEVTLSADDVYPAMADPANVSPEEYKKTLRLYLIGRHKRGDFCRGGLNTMLAAHGIPLYETRRRAQLVVTVDYDPNETDLYTVQTDLRSKMAHVSGLSFHERSGEDIELTLESDTTQG